jgi:DNA-binding Xre family transcriptional regulator
MAKHTKKKMSDAFKKRSRKMINKLEHEELDGLVAKGQRIRERHDRLIDALCVLKAEREAQSVSLSELQRRTGISKSALSRLENDPNPNPTVSTLLRIAEALGREITITITPPNEAA